MNTSYGSYGKVPVPSLPAIYNPRVANSEMTMFRKIEFVNSELAERGPSVFTMFSTPLKARKNAAIYQVISFTNTLSGSTAAPGS